MVLSPAETKKAELANLLEWGYQFKTKNTLSSKGCHTIDGCNWARRESMEEMLKRIDREVLWGSLSILKAIRQEEGRNYWNNDQGV